MHRDFNPIAFLLIAFCMAGFASALTPATQPVAVGLDCHTPMAFMSSYDSLAGEDPPAYLAMYFLNDTDDIQRVAKVQAKFDAQVGMLQKIVQQKWGDDAADQIAACAGVKIAARYSVGDGETNRPPRQRGVCRRHARSRPD